MDVAKADNRVVKYVTTISCKIKAIFELDLKISVSSKSSFYFSPYLSPPSFVHFTYRIVHTELVHEL